jgi:outer membrane protein
MGSDLLQLGEAVEAALAENPEVLRRREVVEEARQTRREVTAEAMPQVTLEANLFRWRDPGFLNTPGFEDIVPPEGGGDGTSELPGFDPSVFRPIPVTQYDYGLRLEQPVVTWGRVPSALRAARRALDGVRLEVSETEFDVARQVAQAYYGLQLAARRIEVFEAQRSSREAQLRRAEDLLALGAGTRLDVLRARSELTNLEPQILRARKDRDQARARLNETMGRPVESSVSVPPLDLEATTPPPPSLEHLLEVAELRRPNLLKFGVDRYLLRQRVKITRADIRPQIDLEAAYGFAAIEPENLYNLDFTSWRVGLYASWVLFDGFRTPARIGQLVSQEQQNRLAESGFRLRLARELEVALGDWREAAASREASTRAVEQAEEAKRVADESYTWGAATSVDVLVADINLREAELNLAQAVHDQWLALANLKFLVGVRADHPLPAAGSVEPLTIDDRPLPQIE